MTRFIIFFMLLLLLSGITRAEQIDVRYRAVLETGGTGLIEYPEIQNKLAVHRVLFDQEFGYLVIELGEWPESYQRSFYHYCGVPKIVVDAMMEHSSASKYYSHEIKGSYDCRTNEGPPY